MIDYTLRKKFPLTKEQNEVIDFMLKRNKAINSCQTGFGKTYTRLYYIMSYSFEVPGYSCNNTLSTKSCESI